MTTISPPKKNYKAMSFPQISEMSSGQKDQLACTMAALLLHDNGSDVDADSLKRVLSAAGVDVASYWPTLFARALQGKDIADFLVVSGGGGGAGPAAGAEAKEEEQEEEEEEEEEVEEESVDMDMGGLFDF